MKKLNEMFSAMKTTVLSMDKKNKTILGIVAVALVGAITFGGYQLSTIGKTVDSDVKQTEKVKKTEDSKKDSSTDKKDTKNQEKKDTEKKKTESQKKDSDKTEKSEKAKAKKETTSTNKGTSDSGQSQSSKKEPSSSNKNNSSSNTQPATPVQQEKPVQKPEPKPQPKPEPAPDPQPTGPTEAEKQARKEAEKQNMIAYAEQTSPGGLFNTWESAKAWANEQKKAGNCQTYLVSEFGLDGEVWGYVVQLY